MSWTKKASPPDPVPSPIDATEQGSDASLANAGLDCMCNCVQGLQSTAAIASSLDLNDSETGIEEQRTNILPPLTLDDDFDWKAFTEAFCHSDMNVESKQKGPVLFEDDEDDDEQSSTDAAAGLPVANQPSAKALETSGDCMINSSALQRVGKRLVVCWQPGTSWKWVRSFFLSSVVQVCGSYCSVF